MTPLNNTNPVFVHWLGITLPPDFELNRVFKEVLQLPSNLFMLRQRGREGYRSCYANDGQTISILTDGGHFAMGHHITITGTACEALGTRVIDVALTTIRLGGKISRIDLAVDDRSGILNMSEVEACIRGLRYTTRFRSPPRIECSVDKKTGRELGKWIKFGKRNSEMYIRIYDKAAEQQQKGSWVRVEIEAKGKNATEIMRRVEQGKTLGEMLFGLLVNYIAFREKSRDPNRSRWPYAKWWSQFLGEVERIQLGTGRANESEKRVDWFITTMDKTLARVVDRHGPAILHEMLESGRRKNEIKHLPSEAA